MLELLKSYFGFDRFLSFQDEIIHRVVAGRDTLVLMPTGGGKSLCYQLPTLCFSGLTLVVSPLIALMKDQVDALKANGIAASFINSTPSSAEISERRGFARSTITGYLEQLVTSGEELNLDHLMPSPEPFKKIESAFRQTGTQYLAPVGESLGEDYSCDELALVRIGLRQGGLLD